MNRVYQPRKLLVLGHNAEMGTAAAADELVSLTVWGLGFRVRGLEFAGLGSRVAPHLHIRPSFRVQGLRFMVRDLGFVV